MQTQITAKAVELKEAYRDYFPYIIITAAISFFYIVVQFLTVAQLATFAGAENIGQVGPSFNWGYQLIALAAIGWLSAAAGPYFENCSWRRVVTGLALWSVGVFAVMLYLQQGFGVAIDFAPVVLLPLSVYICALIKQVSARERRLFFKERALSHKDTLIGKVLETTYDGVVIADYQGKIVYANNTALRLFGYEADEIIGSEIDILSPTAHQGRVGREISHYLNQARDGKLFSRPYETSGLRADDTSFSMDLLVATASLEIADSPYERREEDRIMYVCNMWDLSARKKMEDAQRLALETQVVANRAKSEFVANMSHELRTPLNAIIGFSEMLTRSFFGKLNEKQAEYVNDIHFSGSHLLKLINDILDISKIEAGHSELREEEVRIREVVESCANLVRPKAQESRVSLAVRRVSPMDILYADERKLKQVLINLLSNAIKFTPPGGSVEVCSEIEPDGTYTISVVDSGVGIAPENIDKALAPFGQIDSGLDRKYEGTGLGLPLTKSLIEAHGGTLTLESSLGVGTTIKVRFPSGRLREYRKAS
ncbi:MAG: PAS domain S-box protein [Proteobacteria bacterium]|nr:PAS domain S-box protein [Pseudomonadota bacterium]